MLIFCYNFVVVSKTYIGIDLWRSMRKRLWIVCGISLVVKRDLPKVELWVRFPYTA